MKIGPFVLDERGQGLAEYSQITVLVAVVVISVLVVLGIPTIVQLLCRGFDPAYFEFTGKHIAECVQYLP